MLKGCSSRMGSKVGRRTDKAEVHTLKDGQLKVYRRVDQTSGDVGRIWYYNIAIRGQKQIRYQSTKTDDLSDALAIANSEFSRVAIRVASGINVSKLSFAKVARDTIEHHKKRLEAGDIQKHRFDRMKRTLENVYIPYFDSEVQKELTEIDAGDIEDMLLWRKAAGQMHKTFKVKGKPKFLPSLPPAPTTINVELQVLRAVFRYAVGKKLMLAGQVPPIKSLKTKPMDTRRPHFTTGEWSKVTNYLHHHYLNELPASVGNFKRLYSFYREQNKHLWLLLSLSMCRVGELRNLKWGNIEFRNVRDPRRENQKVERVILSISGKTGKRLVVCQPYAKKIIRRWQEICASFDVSTHPTDYVFRHPNFTNKGSGYIDKPVDTTNLAFQVVLRRVGLETDIDGRRRSVYSIRHSAITWALQGNVNTISVAKNAGTSLEMIQKFYDHSLSTDYISELTKFDVTGADD